MNNRIVDTNVVSFIMRDDSRAADYRALLKGYIPVISFMTVGELYEGAYRGRWVSKRFLRLARDIDYYLIVPASIELARSWGEIRFQRRAQTISAEDAWIAATALLLGAPLVTHNPADFRGIRGLQVLTAGS